MKKVLFIALILVFTLALSGCSDGADSDIFALPIMPETQSALLDTVEQVRLGGFEYSEPRSGFNRHPIQLVDLDGDGEDEGIVFLRDVVDTYKTFIYIFEQSDSVFSLFDIIEGRENEIYTASYSKMLDGEGYELIVKWGKSEEGAHALTAYTLTSDGVEKVLDITAKQFSVSDISGDGRNELLAVSKSGARTYADIYSERSGKIIKVDSVALSANVGEVTRIISGKVSDSVNGAFIERESSAGIVTDIVVYKNGEYANLLPDGDVCSVKALCADVNNDGIIELPKETDSEDNSTDRTYLWRSVDGSGATRLRAFTYHSFSENWFFSMPLIWSKTVSAKRTDIGTQRVKISFFVREETGDDTEAYISSPLFNIYVLKGNAKTSITSDENTFVIAEREDVTFVGEAIATEYLGESIDQDFFKSGFKNRKSDWASEILFA